MKILLDVDDVCLDLLPEWLMRYNNEWGDSVAPEDITEWDMKPFVKCGERIYSYLNEINLYSDVMPVEGALNGITKLRALGNKIIFVTAKSHPFKLHRLKQLRMFDERMDGYAVAANKNLIDGDVLIDDNPANVIGFPREAILFSRPHNTGIHMASLNKFRANGWINVIDLIDEIATQNL